MKLKTIYRCQNCEASSQNWSGKCSSCNSWNSLVEDVIDLDKEKKLSKTPRSQSLKGLSPQQLKKATKNREKFSSGISEFDRVIGQGILPGSLTLLSGEPGIGKSTLTLQIAGNIAKDKEVLLVSGEESVEQIAARAERLKIDEENLKAINEFNLEAILATIDIEKPEFVILDSIQVVSSMDIPSTAGSISQVRYCTERVMEYAKTKHIPVMIIGHVNKDGNLAGPRVLEHLVDTVMHLEGDRHHQFRILRAVKNRFGSCNEIGIFDMEENGMIEVQNPSKLLLEGRRAQSIGSAITVAMEGQRPLLVEVQALVSTSHFGYPKRTANGFDLNRLQILIAALEKYGKLNLQNQDVFINIPGGIKLSEPAADLAIVSAISSSLLKTPLPPDTIIFGEVGLSGELRKVSFQEKRIKEAQSMGLEKSITPTSFKEIKSLIKKLQAPN